MWFGVFLFAAFASQMLSLAQPFVLATVVAEVLEGGASGALVAFAWVFGGGVLARSVSDAASGRVAAERHRRGQEEIVAQVMRQGIVGRMSHTPGMVATRRNEAENVAYMPIFVTNVVVGSIGGVLALGVLAAYHGTLALAALASVGLLSLGLWSFLERLNAGFERLNLTNERATQAYLDAVAGRRTIAACGLIDVEIERVARTVADRAQADGEVRARQGRAMALMASTTVTAHGAMLLVGVWLLGRGALDAGQLVAAMLYGRMFYGAVFDNLNQGWLQLPWYRTLARRHREFLDLPPVLPDPEQPRPRPDRPSAVSLRGVSVADGERAILDGVDLGFSIGSLAVVGRSGVGKSTIGHLVGRLIDPDTGQVTLGGSPVDQLTRDDLASLVGYAFERPALLGSTIREFVTLGRSLGDEEVWLALHASSAREFVERLPLGLDEPVEDAPFSGGEWQRLGIARAIARGPRVLVLDDPTSSLDSITETVVRERLRGLTDECAVLVVAHRASMAAWAGGVAWLRDGVIVEVTTHEELWGDPRYRAAFGEGS